MENAIFVLTGGGFTVSVRSPIFVVPFQGLGRGYSNLIFVILYSFSQRGPQVV